MDQLGRLLKELRGQRSLREISRLSGVSHTYLSSLEKNKDARSGKPRKPTPDTLRKLAKAFNYSYNEFLKMAGYLGGK